MDTSAAQSLCRLHSERERERETDRQTHTHIYTNTCCSCCISCSGANGLGSGFAAILATARSAAASPAPMQKGFPSTPPLLSSRRSDRLQLQLRSVCQSRPSTYDTTATTTTILLYNCYYSYTYMLRSVRRALLNPMHMLLLLTYKYTTKTVGDTQRDVRVLGNLRPQRLSMSLCKCWPHAPGATGCPLHCSPPSALARPSGTGRHTCQRRCVPTLRQARLTSAGRCACPERASHPEFALAYGVGPCDTPAGCAPASAPTPGGPLARICWS